MTLDMLIRTRRVAIKPVTIKPAAAPARPSGSWRPLTRFTRCRTRGVTRGLVPLMIAFLGLLLSLLAVWMVGLLRPPSSNTPTTQSMVPSAMVPATHPAPDSAPTTQPRPLRTYLELVRDNYPDSDDLQTFPPGADLIDAARLFIKQPAMIDESGNLWFADPRGEDPATVLRHLSGQGCGVMKELPARVLTWRRGNERTVLTLFAREQQTLVVMPDGSESMLSIPSRALARMLRVDSWRLFLGDSSAYALNPDSMQVVEFALDSGEKWDSAVVASSGAIAWSERRAVRFVAGKWSPLFETTAGSLLVQVIPLSGGSIRVVCNNDADEADIRSLLLDPRPVDEKLVERWVAQLSAEDGQRRELAYRELERLGPGAWPTLERLLEDQPPEARVRLESLLAEKTDPTIGGYRARSGPIRLAQRWSDGSIVLRAPLGWVRVGADGDRPVSGSLLLLRPSGVPSIAPDDIAELIDSGATLDAVGSEIVARTERGLLRRVGSEFVPVLPKRLSHFSLFRGIDSAGRWLIESAKSQPPLLLLDPTLSDPTPKLPTWSITVPTDGEIGKTADGWPVMRSADAWALRETGWQVVREPRDWEPIVARVEADRSSPSVDLPDGRTRLVMAEPGVLRRVRVADGVERELATHTDGLVPGRFPDAMWLDPAGRLVLVFLPDELVIAFPGGRIPREIANLMPARNADNEE